MHSLGTDTNSDGVVNLGESIVRDRRHQAVGTNIEVDVTGSAKSLDQYDTPRHTVFGRTS